MLKVSPHTHGESFLTASTLENLVEKASKLGREYFAYTDQGTLSSALKSYALAKDKKLKPILGLEFFFYDPSCDIISGTEAARCSYFQGTIYCKDQEAYQELVKVVSRTDLSKFTHYEDEYSLFTWKELGHLAKFNTELIVGGSVHCMVGKVFLAQDPQLASKVFLKLQNLFKDKISVALLCEKWERKFSQVVEILYEDDTKDSIVSSDRVTTDRARNIKVTDLITKNHHKKIKSKRVGDTFFEVNKDIKASRLHKGYLPLPFDVSFRINKVLLAFATKFNCPVIVTDYAFYCDREDKVVQELVLEGKTKLHSTLNMKTEEEFLSYLINVMDISPISAQTIIINTNTWAAKFDNFELKYQPRLAECEGTGIKQVMEIIKKNGRMKWDNKEWIARLKEELDVIENNGIMSMTAYFLPIHDVMAHYKENKRLTGPGRGSAAGSLLAYLMGITQVNPFKYDLSFSRFYSMDRIRDKKLADIDSDLEDRDLLVGKDKKSGYLYGRWGNKAAQISTRTMLRLKSSIKDANRYIKGKVEPEIEIFTKGLPPPPQGVKDSEYIFGYEDQEGDYHEGFYSISDDLQKYAQERPKEWDIVQKMLGITRAQSIHACFSGDTLVDNNGTVSKLKDAKFAQNKPIKVWSNGIKDTILVCLNNGISIKCTPDHKFITHEGEIEAKDLLGKEVIFKPFSNTSGNKELPKEMIFALGWALNDGTFVKERTNQSFYFTPGKDDECRKRIVAYLKSINVNVWGDKDRLDTVYCGSLNLPNEFFESKSTTKQRLPEYFWALNYSSQCIFIQGFMSANGFVLNTRDRIGIKLASKLLVNDISIWFISNGINLSTAYFLPQTFTIRGKTYTNSGGANIELSGFESKQKFKNDVGFFQTYKSNRLAEIAKKKHPKDSGSSRIRKVKCLYIENAGTEEVFDFNEPVENAGYINGILVHNCAFVIADRPITDIVPTKEGHITQYTAKESEKAGLVKYDFLVISQLKDIRVCLEYVNRHDNSDISFDHLIHKNSPTYIWDLPEELEVFKSIWDGDTESIFQISTKSMIPYCMSIKPRSIEDLAIILSLVRPGPLDYIDTETGRSMAEEYVHRRQGGAFKDIAALNDLIPETFSVLVYQEQVTKIAKELAGYDGSKAENLREAIGKKQLTKITGFRPSFIAGCVASGKASQAEAEQLWERIVTFGRYAFNKSHAISYAMVTYACMFLRHHKAIDWWASVATNADEKEITGKFWPHLKPYFAAPDINLSTDEMVIDYKNNKIRAKLGVIRGLGDKTAEPIIAGRPYRDIKDFVNKEVATNSLTRKLIHVGVLDSLFPPRLNFLEKLKIFEDLIQNRAFTTKKAEYEAEGKTLRQLTPKEGILPEQYLNLHPMTEAAMKKGVLPSLLVGLYHLGCMYSKVLKNNPKLICVENNRGMSTPLATSEFLLKLAENDGSDLEKDIYVAGIAFVNEIKEFPFANNTKKALKLNLDFDGISLGELPLWPDYNSGDLIYNKNIVKGCIVTVFLRKKVGKKDLTITELVLESSPKKKKELTKA